MLKAKHKYRVFFEDTDIGGVVYYANYSKFMERARSELFLDGGISQVELSKEGIGFMVGRSEIDYKASATFEDVITVETVVSEIKKVRYSIEQNLYVNDGDKPIVTGVTEMACVALGSGRPKATKIPDQIVKFLEGS